MKFELLCVFVCLVMTNIWFSYTGAFRLRFHRRRTNCKRLAKPRQCRLPRPAVVVSEPVEVIPERRRIVGECFADANRCPTGACVSSERTIYYCFWFQARKMTCPVYGVVNEVKVTETVDCGVFGPRDVDRVTSCTCVNNTEVPIVIRTIDSEDETLLSGVSVSVNGQSVQDPDVDGIFQTSVSLLDTVVVVGADKDGYIRTVRREDIPVGFLGPINIDMAMVKEADQIEMDSTVGREFSISDNPEDLSAGVASITINPNSVRNPDGSLYNGVVQVSVNFVGEENDMINDIAGQFFSINDFRRIQLGTLGLFAITTKDSDDNPVTAESVSITVPSDVMVWSLTPQGFWTPVQTSDGNVNAAGRKRRQDGVNTIITQIPNARWTNLDIIVDQPNCYFKARVFEIDGVTEIPSSPTTSFVPAVQALLTLTTPLTFMVNIPTLSTQTPAATCFAVKCPLPGFGNLFGLINMTSYEIVNVGGTNIPVVTHLIPKALNNYPPTIQTALSSVLFDVSQNKIDISAKFSTDNNGPFYADENTCTNSAIDEVAFHFIKPEVLSYEPLPDGEDLCTSRVQMYVDLFSLETMELPADLTHLTITAVSILIKDGIQFSFTDVTFIDALLDKPDGEFSVCLGYPCSLENSATTVYITITSSNITVPADLFDYEFESSESESSTSDNATPPDGQTITIPALFCSGSCLGPLCTNDLPFSRFSGSFEAPFEVMDGPDFFSATENGCPLIPAEANLAAALYLYCGLNSGKFQGEFPA